MRLKNLMVFALAAAFVSTSMASASADAAKPGQSMTHMKTGAGLSAALEAAGVVLYVQGGATASVIGDSISSANGQYVFHIPITANKAGVQHVGSNIVFFNTANNSQLQLRNPVIDLTKGAVTATVPQAGNQTLDVLTITNASTLKAKVTNDRTEQGWLCNVHLSEFESDGDLQLGPATTGLKKIAIKVSRGVAVVG